ncbi:filamentous haemagglutinin family protein [Pandoraea bronchicola]|uniref:filamentous haemagglutinin family protein n=1 Tax=Pandoraea bronchicola TaxID=2508287 RepID=UPI0015819E14|nr:filamentous haemagglutinin family protein [Pandoraea bronchicola]
MTRKSVNAGRGSQSTIVHRRPLSSTVVYPPPKREYDQWGNVKLSPRAPSTGAGIATRSPIPEVKPGDVDLLASPGGAFLSSAGAQYFVQAPGPGEVVSPPHTMRL